MPLVTVHCPQDHEPFEIRLQGGEVFFVPILVGGGTRSLPDDVLLKLELLDEHRFGSGVVYLRYRTMNQ
jgi:hypothetical protein